MSHTLSILIGLAGIVILFGVAVTVHEFGHFIFAKLFGVRVERFSLGMGKVLWARKWGDTEYALSLLPIGGYVKLTGPVSQELEDEAKALEASDRVKYLEQLLEAKDNTAKRFSSKFAITMAAALGFGVLGWIHPDLYPSLALPLVGLLVGAYAVAGRRREHRELDALDRTKTEADLATARREEEALRRSLRESGEHASVERAIPGITQVSAEEEKIASMLIEDNLALRNKPFHAKFLIFVAGCAMNVLLGYLVLLGMLSIGFTEYIPDGLDVEAPRPGSPLAAYDIREGDVIVSVDGAPLETWKDFNDSIFEAAAEERGVRLAMVRDGERREVELPYAAPEKLTGEPPEGISQDLMYEFRGAPYLHFRPFDPVIIAEVLFNQPSEHAGMKIGDRIVSVGGEPVGTWRHFAPVIEKSAGQPVPIVVEREGQRLDLVVTPREESDGRGIIGVVQGFTKKATDRVSFGEAVPLAALNLYERGRAILRGFYRLFTGQLKDPLKQLGGPVSIGTIAAKKANEGVQSYLNFFVMINLVLAIMNLLPIPLLDGGHIVFSAVESIARRPIPAKVLIGIYNVSFYLIVCLAVFLLGNDIYQNSWRYFGWMERLFG